MTEQDQALKKDKGKMTEPIPGYMLDVARKARLSLSESLMRMDAASSSAQKEKGEAK